MALRKAIKESEGSVSDASGAGSSFLCVLDKLKNAVEVAKEALDSGETPREKSRKVNETLDESL